MASSPSTCAIAGQYASCLGLRTYQQIESDDVRNHQRGHVDDGDRVGGAQLPWYRGEANLVAVEVVDDDIRRANDIEGDDERKRFSAE
jgi:hypothetical protein